MPNDRPGCRRAGLPWPGRRSLLAGAVLSASLAAAGPAHAAYKPRVAVVMCEESYAQDWYAVQASSQGLVGLAGLVGVPYETLTLTEFLASPSSRFTSVWFGGCGYVNSDRIMPLAARLESHVAAGGSVFLDAPLATTSNDKGSGQYNPMSSTFPYLGLIDGQFQSLQGATVRTTRSTHKIAAHFGLAAVTTLTQGLAEMGMETFSLSHPGTPGNDVLLEMVPASGSAAVPYLLVSAATGGARVLAAGSYAASGVATPFRNEAPAGFYDNRLMPYLVDALCWLVGPENEPFVGLQLSHAPMTVIGRLDGDASEDTKSVQTTLDYLIDLSKRSGVNTVYGVVAGLAEKGTTWNLFGSGGSGLQQLGGSVGSHSQTHPDDMNVSLNDAGWTSEVAGSLQNIRTRLTGGGFTPDAYAFINPGETIHREHYGRFFGAIDLFMTHGLEEDTPYATGVMGFGLPAGVARKPVINNVTAPDFQWLFLNEWNYTPAVAAATQKKILAWYQERVGRGVLYNEMWHDYGIGDTVAVVHYPKDRARPLYDANRDYFEQNRIYAPAVHELVGKMYLAQGSTIASAMNGAELRATLDTSALPATYRAEAAGMGLRVNASTGPITAVTLNGAPYYAFTSDTVILPQADATQELGVRFGAPSDAARLTYISKAFTRVAKEGDTLTVALRQAGLMTKFCFAGSPAHVVLNADAYRRSGEELCGELRFGTAAVAIAAQRVDTGATGLHVTAADRPITSATWNEATLTLTLAQGAAGRIDLESGVVPESITVNGQPRGLPSAPGPFNIAVADAAAGTIVIHMPASSVGSPTAPAPMGNPEDSPPATSMATGCVYAATGEGHTPLGALLLAGLLATLAALNRAWRPRASSRLPW